MNHTVSDQDILDFYRSDLDHLDTIIYLKDGREFSCNELMEYMQDNSEFSSEFSLIKNFKSYKFIGYDKVYDGTNGITVEDIKNMIKLGLLKDYPVFELNS